MTTARLRLLLYPTATDSALGAGKWGGGPTFGINTESTYDWQAYQWTVPVNFYISQLLKFGKQPISLQIGYRYYAEAPDGGPKWGLRFSVTFLFPT